MNLPFVLFRYVPSAIVATSKVFCCAFLRSVFLISWAISGCSHIETIAHASTFISMTTAARISASASVIMNLTLANAVGHSHDSSALVTQTKAYWAFTNSTSSPSHIDRRKLKTVFGSWDDRRSVLGKVTFRNMAGSRLLRLASSWRPPR